MLSQLALWPHPTPPEARMSPAQVAHRGLAYRPPKAAGGTRPFGGGRSRHACSVHVALPCCSWFPASPVLAVVMINAFDYSDFKIVSSTRCVLARAPLG